MQVILLKDVKNVGKKDQTVNVSDGYANNYLFKNKLAVPVSKKSVEILADQKEAARQLEEKKKADALVAKDKLKDITLEFHLNAGKDSRVFGSISTKQIAEELQSKYGIDIDKRKFVGKNTVDSLGYHKLQIELYKGVIGEVTVHVLERK